MKFEGEEKNESFHTPFSTKNFHSCVIIPTVIEVRSKESVTSLRQFLKFENLNRENLLIIEKINCYIIEFELQVEHTLSYDLRSMDVHSEKMHATNSLKIALKTRPTNKNEIISQY